MVINLEANLRLPSWQDNLMRYRNLAVIESRGKRRLQVNQDIIYLQESCEGAADYPLSGIALNFAFSFFYVQAFLWRY